MRLAPLTLSFKVTKVNNLPNPYAPPRPLYVIKLQEWVSLTGPTVLSTSRLICAHLNFDGWNDGLHH